MKPLSLSLLAASLTTSLCLTPSAAHAQQATPPDAINAAQPTDALAAPQTASSTTTLAPIAVQTGPRAAESASTATVPPAPYPEVFYGWPIVGVDIANLVVSPIAILVAGSSARFRDPLAAVAIMSTVALVGYVFTGPIVHWSRGHRAVGFKSLAIRSLGSLAVGAVLSIPGFALAGPGGGLIFGVAGTYVGMISMSIVDNAMNPYDRPVPDDMLTAPSSFSFAPFVTPVAGAGGWLAGVSGTF
ncbi:MAG: hypothetical protein Q8Q09_25635 [Deltaproteobacteria bacterium]|nr:hypothetical protein [Deltaproteobacteria bacterium]